MADPGRSETLTDERADELAGTDVTDTASGTTGTTGTETSEHTPETPDTPDSSDTPTADVGDDAAEPVAASGTDDTLATDDDTDLVDEHDEHDTPPRPWALIAATAVAALAVVALAVTAFLVPGWAIKPGSPDSRAEQATSALAAKDPAGLDAVSCRNQQGAPTNPFPAEALSLVQQARQAGPPQLELDTQARAPVELTLSAQGQTQNLPADIVMGVTDGQWCMAGISQRG